MRNGSRRRSGKSKVLRWIGGGTAVTVITLFVLDRNADKLMAALERIERKLKERRLRRAGQGQTASPADD